MQKKKIFILTIALLTVFVLAGCGKNDQTKTNSKADNDSAEEAMSASDKMGLNEETGEYESNKKTSLPQSNIQNNFIVTLEKIELTKDKTEAFFKVINKNDFNFHLYFGFAKIVQGTRQYESKKDDLPSEYMPNVEVNGSILFPVLESKEIITLYINDEPGSSSYDTKWEEIEFKIDLSGDGVVDRVAEEEKQKQIEKEKMDKFLADKEYTKYLFPYRESGSGGNTSSSMDGFQWYARVILFEKGKELDLSIGYLDDKKNWNEVKRFIGNEYDPSANDPLVGSYDGYFTKIDDSDYRSEVSNTTGIKFNIDKDSVKLTTGNNPLRYRNEKGEMIYIWIDDVIHDARLIILE